MSKPKVRQRVHAAQQFFLATVLILGMGRGQPVLSQGSCISVPCSVGTTNQLCAFAITNNGTGRAICGSANSSGVFGQGQIGVEGNGINYGIYGSSSGYGVYGSGSKAGVYGSNSGGIGGLFEGQGATAPPPSTNAIGVLGRAGDYGVYGTAYTGVAGFSPSFNGNGILGDCHIGPECWGVTGQSASGVGVVGRGGPTFPPSHAYAAGAGVFGHSSANDGRGVFGEANVGSQAYGVYGQSSSGSGGVFYGNTVGVFGHATSPNGTAIYGNSQGVAVMGIATSSTGVAGDFWGTAGGSTGVQGTAHSNGIAVHGINTSPSGYAGYFDGNVRVTNLFKAGGSFEIDHPQDPANKYLYHSFVESNERRNLYDGIVTTNEKGEAWVTLPGYFEALNKDFRYQLTTIGKFAQAIVDREISKNRFHILTDKPNVKVSWQVTGIRKDAWARQHPLVVEVGKVGAEKGRYLYPKEQGQPETLGIHQVRSPNSPLPVPPPSRQEPQPTTPKQMPPIPGQVPSPPGL